VMARKSLGGIQTDLSSRVLRPDGHPIEGLYAAGEAAGFGGGGMHGKRSLEGTFLGGCVFSGRIAARTIAAGAGQPVSPTAPAGRAPTHAAPGAGSAPALKPTS
jgi:succinate dehydrogenase/fumarate reductase flavoprotein subunit